MSTVAMTQNPLRQLADLGQSVWYDNIQRDLLDGGELRRMVESDGLTGVTSNPTIFDKAIGASDAYDAAIARALGADPDADSERLFFAVAMDDIRDAADVLAQVYHASGRRDGFVSLEVSPQLAEDTEGTVRQALSLARELDRPNVMIKVPATRAGLPAIERLTAAGVNVNVTLLFSVERYRQVVAHWLRGLEQRCDAGEPVDGVASVASFFVSRVDTAVDKALEQAASAGRLRGRAAIANAATAYRHFLDVFDGARFERLRAAGAQPQRLLWASTGTKNPEYSDVLYVTGLAAARTVTTLPPSTYDAFLDHGRAEPAMERAMAEAEDVLAGLAAAGIDLDAITARLEVEGVAAFSDSYRHLLTTLAAKAASLSDAHIS